MSIFFPCFHVFRIVKNLKFFKALKFAFWIADRRDVLEMVEHPGFMISDTSSNKYPLIREDASCLKGPMMLPRYNYTHVMPANLQTMMIHDMCQVWHMSNSYVSKGMARYDAAARIT